MSRSLLLALLAALTLAAAIASLLFGPVDLSVGRLLATASGHGDSIATTILFELRLPRTVLALVVGAILGLAGAALQGYLRNPLAEPSVLGTSNAAALGGVAALYFGFAQIHPAALPLLAIGGALLSLAVLFALAGRSESPLTLILAGLAVGTLAVAGTSLALNLSPNPFAAMEIMTWLLGSLENRSFEHVWIALPCVAIGAAMLLWNSRALDALTLGEDAAQALGVDIRRLRLRLLVGTAIGVGGAVAVAGAIGFVGLIVPHLMRPLTDRSPSATLLPSAIGGAALLVLADIGVRIIPTTNELKLGVVTAFLGVPIFLVHLMREKRIW
ncbi:MULTISPECIES: iron ABC transporter permease [unclassified Sphingopyxis]|uniref:FecCD family ABC transporter permease n=1 Tax=unclassified Sphingopyxis TaxID=2614943 RepID=UPI000731B55E|nr:MULTISPECIES: iron ABC transporter permease [unclassified Sphingopyxis]KTE27388.1 ABC transporter permease [Sphingopyxis sp. H057]KTE54691.1 ABC transporter permease [Sphingopyxis sp. H073]KTE57017.1 ABC transporter permease [Sphingopyxis sp. H071]KTE60094.1 ABC transporter permease [Sphingopyxis sp. H107]KTE67867.1 ABC transporter permease [Sphingopyxis sp. H100]